METRARRGTKKLWLIAASVGIIIVICWKLFPAVNQRTARSRDDRTKGVIQQLASEVEALRLKTGNLPSDETNLTNLLAKPLPLSAWNTPLKYSVTNGNFRIETVSPYPHWMIFEYDSSKPTAGVAVYSF